MTDIVWRLRQPNRGKTEHEAADEIERLRKDHMTDEQEFLALMKRFEISPRHSVDGPHSRWSLEAERGGVNGYGCFVCDFDFDGDGKFISVGIWE